MSENKKKNAADNLPPASGHPDAKAGQKESLFKDGEQFIVISFKQHQDYSCVTAYGLDCKRNLNNHRSLLKRPSIFLNLAEKAVGLQVFMG
tara:strand:- start:1509 stop:1781 length:273 start_codon:yes stop_codon:yes gene_type:complete